MNSHRFSFFLINGLLAASLLGGCGSTPVVDNSPKNPTAVTRAEGRIGGFVLPDATFTEVNYTRTDRRASSTKQEYDSWMARQFFGNSKETEILRMDRKIRWYLFENDDEKTYTECPLKGCSQASLKRYQPDKKQADKQEKPQLDYDPNNQQDSSCPLKQTRNSFEVRDTGKTRQIAGYTAREYTANWIVEYTDPKGRKDSNRLLMTFWNTDPDANMQKVWKIEAEANRNYLKAIGMKQTDLSLLLPDEITTALTAFVNSQQMRKFSKEMGKIKGHNMASKVAWYLDRKACIEPKKAAPKQKSFSWSDPMSALTNVASDMAADKMAGMFVPDPNEPVLSYSYEVKQVGIEDIHDSVFEVPPGFKKVSHQ